MKIVSLFCGCGGLDLGLREAGHKIVHASDFDKDSIDTYNSYFSHKADLIDVHDLIDQKKTNIYKGWMISSSPDVTPLENPIYDLWLLDCINDKTS